MTLRYRFENARDVLAKLERERDRVFEAVKTEHQDDMCDVFFNFCVTAHALREWVKNDAAAPPDLNIHEICNEYDVLKACRDVANSHKHFDFVSPRDTPMVARGTSPMVDVYRDLKTGKLSVAPPRESPDIMVMLGTGHIVGLWEFTTETLRVWRILLERYLPTDASL